MPWRSVRTCCPATFITPMRKNLTSSIGPPLTFSSTCHAFGPCTWNRQTFRHGLAHRAHRRAVVLLDLDVVPSGRGLELEPVRRRSAADEDEFVRVEVEEDAVPDDVARRRRGHVLLRHVDGEALDAVDRRVRDQLQRVGAPEEEIDHVVRLVVEDCSLPPGPLLATPVRELGGDDGVDVRADL